MSQKLRPCFIQSVYTTFRQVMFLQTKIVLFYLRVQKEKQLWVLLDPRGHQGLQGLVMMGVQVLQDHLDLQDPSLLHFPELEHTGPINVSGFFFD